MEILTFVRQFVKVGIAIIPLYHRSKTPMLPTWREYQNRLPTTTEYQSWFATDWNNYAVVCGWDNLVVIDFDNIEYFNLWSLVEPELSSSAFKVQTRKGMHVYVRTESPVANDKRISRSAGIDIQAQGKYVVGPGSVHPSGTQYVAIGEMNFPMVESIDAILPLDLFPRVRADDVVFNGTPIPFHNATTEYLADPFTDTRDLISKVKAAVRIESLFSDAYSTGNGFLAARCPFHDDKRPSFWINTRRQLCGCQVCGMKPMDVLNLYSRMHHISNAAAVTALAADIGIWR